MRTTVDIDDDVLLAAKEVAKQRGLPMGKVLSDLARQGLTGRVVTTTRNGVPLFPRQPEASIVTSEFINQLRDETL
ncbi:MAG: CopG family transcriptional regulator [Anaerolineae bacterium]|nr:CopG family transcriptional regulator [Anaerolineae bacterium]